MSIKFPESWVFRCFKRGKGRFNKFKVIDVCQIKASEMIEKFNQLPEYEDCETETQPVKSSGFPVLKEPAMDIKPALDDEAAH